MGSYLYVLVISFCFALFFRLNRTQSRKPLPPGPQGTWLTGIKDQLPSTEPWKTYAAWSTRFSSPILSYRIYNRTTVLLNDHKSVRALLDQRAHIYSDRPLSWMFHVTCGRRKTVFNISSSDPRHRIYRRLLHSGLGHRATADTWPSLKEQTAVLMHGLVVDPQKWQQHVRRHSAAVIMKLAFGYSIESLDDPFIKVADECSKITGWATIPGRWLVDYYPLLRFVPSFFPYMHWKKQGLIWKDALEHLSDVPHNWVKNQMSQGIHEVSFTSRVLELLNKGSRDVEENEDVAKWCAGGLYAGAADTTVSAITSFVLLMALHPGVQMKAQEEISSRLSTYDFTDLSDIPNITEISELPYLTAVLMEVLRYAPVGNLALPHGVVKDDEYAGYRIPEGATVMANVWAIMHDPALYPEPFKFDPERFIDDTTGAREKEPDPRQFAYGFGRRVCPGLHFSQMSILLVMAATLARFSILMDPNQDTSTIPEFTTGITSHIKLFSIRIIPRIRETR